MTTGADVVTAARGWMGTPFAHQHRAKAIYVDCAGLIIGVARELALVASDFDVTGYARQPDGVSLLALCDMFMTRIPFDQARAGDAAAFSFDALPSHLGILSSYRHGGFALIHASTSATPPRVVEHRLMQHARMRVVGAWRLPGVEWAS